MDARHVFQLCVATALVTIGTGLGWGGAIAAQESRTDAEEGVEVLTRGPVHEAFAETVTFDPEPGIVVTKAPPESIEELPPEQRPAGTKQGFQWTSGYWSDAQGSEIEYLPEPPETVEVGPNIAPPSADDSWIPGSRVWNQGRYAWRPGYWMTVRTNWDWIPAHYVWAPRGYVFVDGYWDYSVGRRGVLFAPVQFDAVVYARPGFSYSPTTVIDLAVFSDHLFVRPHYSHYYFGDYYAPSYRAAGFRASSRWATRAGGRLWMRRLSKVSKNNE